MKRFTIVVGLVMIASFLASCGAPEQATEIVTATAEPKEEAEEETPISVTMATPVDPESLDPAYDTMRQSISIMTQVYDRLVWRDESGALVSGLASSWEFVDDTTLEMSLREGVLFHNGEVLTADDVVFTFDRLLDEDDPLPLSSYVIGSISTVERVDDYTVRITTPTPRALVIAEIARIAIVSEKAVTEAGDSYGSNPIGTGPYRFVDWDKNEKIVFRAFADHWRGRPEVDEVVFKIIPDEFARFASLTAGEVDVICELPPERIAQVEDDPTVKLSTVQSARNMFVGMNTWEPPFDDVRVRQAMNHAVDVELIVDTVLGGHGFPNQSVCAQTVAGYDPNLDGYEYDPERARELLAEAGYPEGLEVNFWGPNGKYLKDKEIQEAIGAQLAEVGVKVNHIMPEWAEYWGTYKPGECDGLQFLGTGNSLLDCDMTMTYRLYSKTAGQYFNSPRLDALIEEEQRELDPERRMEIFEEIQQYIRDQAAWIFLYDKESVCAMSTRFDWHPRPDELQWAYDITVVE